MEEGWTTLVSPYRSIHAVQINIPTAFVLSKVTTDKLINYMVRIFVYGLLLIGAFGFFLSK